MRLGLALWTVTLIAGDLVALVALPGWGTTGSISGRTLWLVLTVLLAFTWVLGAVALLLVRHVRGWLRKRRLVELPTEVVNG